MTAKALYNKKLMVAGLGLPSGLKATPMPQKDINMPPLRIDVNDCCPNVVKIWARGAGKTKKNLN